MTKIDDVLWLADKLKEAGLVTDKLRTAIQTALDEARAEERERAAKIADDFDENQDYGAGDEIRKGPTP